MDIINIMEFDGIVEENIIVFKQDDKFNPLDPKQGCGCRGQGCGCNTDYGCCGRLP